MKKRKMIKLTLVLIKFAFQGVLVRDEDIAGTRYRFTLSDGSTVEVNGDEEIEYDGETHTAANLYDALKEGYYGKL